MSRLETCFARARAEGRPALICYLPVGFPDLDATLDLVPALVRGGADAVELGVPFSDPLADGTTIQRASQRALENGVTLGRCLETAARVRQRVDVPLLLMGYYNPFLRYGLARLTADAAQAGADGFIVPDLPPEEADELCAVAQPRHLAVAFLVAPTSTEERIAAVAARAQGFVYCVSLTGVTGAREALRADLATFLARVRGHTALPLAVGFGVARPEHVRSIGALADGVIVGSALIDHLDRLPAGERVAGAAQFVGWLRGAAAAPTV
ncbi:MAG: tryptophan synthase subunit alpha [Chloroflexi bacterium]|nr:tryptophan synthase subunit alpha [Chloroflexota bacterium]